MNPLPIALNLLGLASFLLVPTTAFSGAPELTSHQPARQSHEAVLQSDGSANSYLYDLLQSEDTSTNVVLEGFVSKRRALGSSLSFLDIIPWKQGREISSNELASIAPVQAILRREFWDEECSGGSFDVYHKILQPGTKVRLQGTAGPSRVAGEAMVFVSQAQYQLPNANPQHLRNVLKFARDGLLDVGEVSSALPNIDRKEFWESVMASPSQTCGELATAILSKFPPKLLLNPSHLMGATNSAKVALLPPVPDEYAKPLTFTNWSDLDKENEQVLSVAAALEKKVGEQSITNDVEILPCTISGWVQNRRRYSDNVTVLELVDNFSSLASMAGADVSDPESDETLKKDNIEARNSRLKDLWKGRIYCVLHSGLLEDSEYGDQADIYGNILCSGARVALQGYLVMGKPAGKKKSDSNVATFWVANCRLLRSSWRPRVVRNVLDLLAAGRFDIEEASESLDLSYSNVEYIASKSDETSSTDRQWMAAEVSKSLQGENSRVGKISSAMRQSLETYASVRDEYPIEIIEATICESDGVGSKASKILESTGTPLRTSPNGSRWQNKKKPQLEWMLGQIDDVIRSHPEYGHRPLQVVDVGGGKGSLSNLLAEAFGEDLVVVQVVDISQSAIRNGQMRAMRRGLENIHYDAKDATTLDVSGVDVVVALHACGALSDVALGHAVREGAGYVITPCCFRSNPQLRVPLPASPTTSDEDLENRKLEPSKHGIELVTVDEWLNVDSTSYESLKQLAELQGDITMSSRAMHSICGLRASAVQRRWQNSRWRPDVQLSTKIKSFPIGFSTRNLCLVGKFELR
jgi:SAM-dependent methyltransferase